MSTEDLLAGPRTGTVGIVGAGTVGRHVAAACAAGHEVQLIDLDATRAAEVARSVEKPQHVRPVEQIAELARCDLLIEAVNEDRTIKIDVLRALANHAGEDTLLVTTTSSFTVTELAAGLPVPDRLVGVHVMPATPGGRLAEITVGELTSEIAVERVLAFAGGVGWIPLRVEDRPGRLTRRLVMPFVNQVIQACDDGLATAADIDRVVVLGLGHRRGPFAVLDSTGLDDHLAATTRTFAAVHDPALAPPPLLTRTVAAGRYGDKTGAGFHTKEQQ